MLNQPANKKVVLVLFHNDLRVHDNATLLKAAQLTSGYSHEGNHNNQDTGNHAIHNSDGRLILLYAPSLADELVQSNRTKAYNFAEMGHARQRFLCESLSDLSQSLERLGNTLLYLQPYDNSNSKPNDNPKRSSTFTLLCQLIEQQHVTDICVSATADYAQNKVYAILQNKYPPLCWHVQATATLFEQMPTDDLPKSFTQFRKKVESDNNLLAADSDITIANLPERCLHSLRAWKITENTFLK